MVSGVGFREDDVDEVMDAVAEFQLQRARETLKPAS
jgi:hypothetical protein